MRTLSLSLFLIASMAFVVPGCSENSSSVVTPSDQSLSLPVASVALEKGGVVHSATGGGRVSDFWGQEVRWTFSFSAREFGDGGCSGEVQFVDHTGVRFHGTIIDLNVVDNKAKLCWTFTSGPWVGLFGCAVVEDDGEGQNASGPEMMTGILWTDGSDIGSGTISGIQAMTPDEFIDWLESYLFPIVLGLPPGLPGLVPASTGNVQVRYV